MYTPDTIVAPATAAGQGAVAVVRLSGPSACAILHQLWHPLGSAEMAPRRLYLGTVRDPISGASIDRALAVVMPGPKSFTGEDVAEIHCHGGTFIVRQIVAAALSAGARMAGPGEFSRRAFLNGRIDLAEAEAIADLVAAQSEKALAQALSQLSGALSSKVRALREQVLAIRAYLEAQIDFSDEDLTLPGVHEIDARCLRLFADLKSLHDSFARGRLMRTGAKAAIIGKPNVGKSSLLNLLLGVERAIVTPTPGTTRDLIEDVIKLGAYSLIMQDGAGIRETAEIVERIGVERVRAGAAQADLLLVVLDASRPLEAEDREVLDLCLNRPALVVLNKIDLPRRIGPDDVRRFGFSADVVEVCATRGDGLDKLRAALSEKVGQLGGECGNNEAIAISRERHRVALAEALGALESARNALRHRMPPEIVVLDINAVAHALATITGEVTSEDVLDLIFSEFCIGK
jgi:tRNA modification GTPase